MVFVQIIQTEIFDTQLFDGTSKKDYCFWEWCHARGRFGNDEERFVFILGEDNREWLNMPPDIGYREWHSHVAAKKAPPTPLHRVFNSIRIEETTQFFEKIRDRDIVGA
jgi:hypothetical protein